MSKYKVLLTDYAWPDLEIEHRALAEIDAELIVVPEAEQDPASLARLARGADAIMTNWAKVPAEVLDSAPECRIVSRLGIGLDNIDIKHATSRGMLVTNIPDYCLVEVAEHALALLLALGRKVAFYHYQTKQGRYDLKAGPVLRRIAGQTLGIVGLGNIGTALATRARRWDSACWPPVARVAKRPRAFAIAIWTSCWRRATMCHCTCRSVTRPDT